MELHPPRGSCARRCVVLNVYISRKAGIQRFLDTSSSSLHPEHSIVQVSNLDVQHNGIAKDRDPGVLNSGQYH